MSSSTTTDIAIIGDGLVGLCCARAFLHRGARVALIGERQPGMASVAAAGLLAPSIDPAPGIIGEFATMCRDRYPSFVAELAEQTGLTVPLVMSGILRVALDEAEADALRSTADGDSAWVPPGDVRVLEPALSPTLGGLLHARDGGVDPSALVAALDLALEGRTRREQALVERLELSEASVRCVLTSGERIDSDYIVVAAGAWVRRIPGMPRPIPVTPLRGQMAAYEGLRVSRTVFGANGYLVSRPGEHVWVGTTAEDAGFVSETTAEGLAHYRSLASASRSNSIVSRSHNSRGPRLTVTSFWLDVGTPSRLRGTHGKLRHSRAPGGTSALATEMADTLYQIIGRHRAEPLPERKPSWLKVKAPGGPEYMRLKGLMRELNLHTVCEEARCPNVGECWEHGTATFMVLGDVCTRNCAYCAVAHGRPPVYDVEEPSRVASAIAQMRLQHAVITSVDRDDLPDFGAWIFAETIRQIHDQNPGCSVEVLVPDFQGREDSIRMVLEAKPEIYNHNTETVPRLYKKARPGGRYERVMKIFRYAKAIAPNIPTKTGIILGMGEAVEEVLAVMRDLRDVDVDILTLGQYLRPSADHIPLDRYYTPDEFRELRAAGMAMGFRHVEAGPLVRSSYHAWEQVQAAGMSA